MLADRPRLTDGAAVTPEAEAMAADAVTVLLVVWFAVALDDAETLADRPRVMACRPAPTVEAEIEAAPRPRVTCAKAETDETDATAAALNRETYAPADTAEAPAAVAARS